MRGPWASWPVALRIARRDARRSPWRSLLVVAMVALPVLGVTAVDVVVRTYELSDTQAAERALGAADVAVADSGFARVEQTDGQGWTTGDSAATPPRDPARDLPAGSRALPDRESSGAVSASGRTVRADLRELAYADPVARGLYRQAAGRPPSGAGETALTTALARRLHVGLGDVVALPGRPDGARVVGLVTDSDRYDAVTALLGPGALPADVRPRLLVDLPAPPTWALVQRLNAGGTVVTTRGARLPGQPSVSTPPGVTGDTETLAAVVLVVGMALLEVVLLAGPAFAVGAKRQERDLALLAAAGAERRDVRRTVLATGLVLGGVAALVGAVGGVVTARLALPLVPRVDAAVPGPFDVRLLEVLGIALVGVGTAVAAAVLPAVSAARQDVLAALTGRRGARRGRPWVPVAGLAVAVAGAVLALQGARRRQVDVILAGAALAELGLVATTPALVGLVGRLGRSLPAAPRLALRDAARNRARTAPAVSAILAAVAGAVAVGTYVSSLDRDDAQGYEPRAAAGAVLLSLDSGQPQLAPVTVAALRRALPGAPVAVVSRPAAPPGDAPADPTAVVGLGVVPPADRACPVPPPSASTDPRCSDGVRVAADAVVGDADALTALTGAREPALAAALAAGGAVVPAAALDGDSVTLRMWTAQGDVERRARVPAVALPASARQQVVLGRAAADALGLRLVPDQVVALPAQAPTQGQEDTLRSALESQGAPAESLYVERGYTSGYGVGLLALLVGSAVLVLGASGIATGLAAAEGRADLSTLAAVGASPGLRRVLAASQSVVTAGLGSLLGVAAGLVPAVGLIRAVNAPDATGYQRPVPFPTVVPWGGIALLAVGVPLLAGLAAAALTRSRLPLVRRLA